MGNSVLLLKNEKDTTTLHATINNKRSDEKMAEKSGIVFIGNKPTMSYVLAIITSLSASNAKEITLKARGRAITTAVDVAEITRNRFLKDLKVSKISIGTEEMPPREGENRARMVSTMEIMLTKE
jgi:DNA-binding protein